MKRVLISLLILIVLEVLFQPLAARALQPILPLVNFIPIFLVFWAWQLEGPLLAWLVLTGGLLTDFLIPDAIGSSPVVWGLLVLLIRTQRSLIVCYGYAYVMLVTFAATFLFLIFDRMAFLILQGGQLWNDSLNLYLFTASLFNAALSPFCFIILKPLYRARKEESRFLTNVYT